MNRTTMNLGKMLYQGIYRGICINNRDPKVQGRIKMHVPGVYPEEFAADPTNLPWALPVMPIFGGSWQNPLTGCLNKETGVSSNPLMTAAPYEGAQLAVYFENGNHLHPVYFGAFQCSSGWLADTNEQHVIKTKNVTIVVDESPVSGMYDETSLSGSPSGQLSGGMVDYSKNRIFTDSHNANCTYLAQNDQCSRKHMPTRVGIRILNNMENGCALDVSLTGVFNMYVSGDVYEEISGNKFTTIHGDYYQMVHGTIHRQAIGPTLFEGAASNKEIIKGSNLTQVLLDSREKVAGNQYHTIGKNRVLGIQGLDDKTVSLGCSLLNKGANDTKNLGASSISNYDSHTTSTAGNLVNSTGMLKSSTNAMGEIRMLEGLFGNFEWDLGPRWELNTGITEGLVSLVPAPMELKMGAWTGLKMFSETYSVQGPTIREYVAPVTDLFASGWRVASPVNISLYAGGIFNIETGGMINILAGGALTMMASIATLQANGLLDLAGLGGTNIYGSILNLSTDPLSLVSSEVIANSAQEVVTSGAGGIA